EERDQEVAGVHRVDGIGRAGVAGKASAAPEGAAPVGSVAEGHQGRFIWHEVGVAATKAGISLTGWKFQPVFSTL
ncbi:MAG: hypothetical protein RLZZ451_2280, partial [Pseudomonadota bacterium]